MNQPIWQIPLDFLGSRSSYVGWMDTRTVFFPRVQNEQTANSRAIFRQARVCLLNQLGTSRQRARRGTPRCEPGAAVTTDPPVELTHAQGAPSREMDI